MIWLEIAGGLVVLALLLFRFNGAWIYIWDRAKRNGRDSLPREYEIPRYYRAGPDGSLDYEARWPGWDGWYFFLLPDDRDLPLKMARASLMTGLYGLEGIDNYERLLLRLSTFEAAEYLCLAPSTMRTPSGIEKRNNFSQHYLPKESSLRMSAGKLDISLAGQNILDESSLEQYGRIAGAWPDYQFSFYNPEADVRIDLTFHGENLLWWADLPGVFTYVTSLGRFEGTVVFGQGTVKADPHQIPDQLESFKVAGTGGFEHGFAHRFFSANALFFPVRLFNYVVPSFRPIRYHYELFIGDGYHRGGFMHASALGVNVRDRGGLYLEGRYIAIDGVRIEYHNDPEPDEVLSHCPPRGSVTFYRRWTVRARTSEGELVYTATREWPPAPVAPNMTYYHFVYEGSFRGEAIRGRGYGEYVHI